MVHIQTKICVCTKGSLIFSGSLGPENEERLVKHIKALYDAGFGPDQTTVRRMAYEFACALNLDHSFEQREKNLLDMTGFGLFSEDTLT